MSGFKTYPIKEALEIIQNAKIVKVSCLISFGKTNREGTVGQDHFDVALSKKDKAEMVKKFSNWGDDLTLDILKDGKEIYIGSM
jgi:hypothetical protein